MSIAAQLKVQTVKDKRVDLKRSRPSLLFDPKVASTIDTQTIYDLGCNGIKELTKLDNVFAAFENTLFNRIPDNGLLIKLTPDMRKKLDKSIIGFLRLLSPYFLYSSSHKCQEFLIRCYSIQEYNVDAIIECCIPYHETALFAKMISILNLDTTNVWSFLQYNKLNGLPLPRSVLVERCIKNPSILRFICEMSKIDTYVTTIYSTLVPTVTKTDLLSNNTIVTKKVSLHFYTITIIELLNNVDTITDNLLTMLLPYILNGLCDKELSLRLSSYMMLTKLKKCINLDKDIFTSIIKKLCYGIPKNSSIEELKYPLLCLLSILQDTDGTVHTSIISKDIFIYLINISNIFDTLFLINDTYDAKVLIWPLIHGYIINIVNTINTITTDDDDSKNTILYKSVDTLLNIVHKVDIKENYTTLVVWILSSFIPIQIESIKYIIDDDLDRLQDTQVLYGIYNYLRNGAGNDALHFLNDKNAVELLKNKKLWTNTHSIILSKILQTIDSIDPKSMDIILHNILENDTINEIFIVLNMNYSIEYIKKVLLLLIGIVFLNTRHEILLGMNTTILLSLKNLSSKVRCSGIKYLDKMMCTCVRDATTVNDKIETNTIVDDKTFLSGPLILQRDNIVNINDDYVDNYINKKNEQYDRTSISISEGEKMIFDLLDNEKDIHVLTKILSMNIFKKYIHLLNQKECIKYIVPLVNQSLKLLYVLDTDRREYILNEKNKVYQDTLLQYKKDSKEISILLTISMKLLLQIIKNEWNQEINDIISEGYTNEFFNKLSIYYFEILSTYSYIKNDLINNKHKTQLENISYININCLKYLNDLIIDTYVNDNTYPLYMQYKISKVDINDTPIEIDTIITIIADTLIDTPNEFDKFINIFQLIQNSIERYEPYFNSLQLLLQVIDTIFYKLKILLHSPTINDTNIYDIIYYKCSFQFIEIIKIISYHIKVLYTPKMIDIISNICNSIILHCIDILPQYINIEYKRVYEEWMILTYKIITKYINTQIIYSKSSDILYINIINEINNKIRINNLNEYTIEILISLYILILNEKEIFTLKDQIYKTIINHLPKYKNTECKYILFLPVLSYPKYILEQYKKDNLSIQLYMNIKNILEILTIDTFTILYKEIYKSSLTSILKDDINLLILHYISILLQDDTNLIIIDNIIKNFKILKKNLLYIEQYSNTNIDIFIKNILKNKNILKDISIPIVQRIESIFSDDDIFLSSSIETIFDLLFIYLPNICNTKIISNIDIVIILNLLKLINLLDESKKYLIINRVYKYILEYNENSISTTDINTIDIILPTDITIKESTYFIIKLLQTLCDYIKIKNFIKQDSLSMILYFISNKIFYKVPIIDNKYIYLWCINYILYNITPNIFSYWNKEQQEKIFSILISYIYSDNDNDNTQLIQDTLTPKEKGLDIFYSTNIDNKLLLNLFYKIQLPATVFLPYLEIKDIYEEYKDILKIAQILEKIINYTELNNITDIEILLQPLFNIVNILTNILKNIRDNEIIVYDDIQILQKLVITIINSISIRLYNKDKKNKKVLNILKDNKNIEYIFDILTIIQIDKEYIIDIDTNDIDTKEIDKLYNMRNINQELVLESSLQLLSYISQNIKQLEYKKVCEIFIKQLKYSTHLLKSQESMYTKQTSIDIFNNNNSNNNNKIFDTFIQNNTILNSIIRYIRSILLPNTINIIEQIYFIIDKIIDFKCINFYIILQSIIYYIIKYNNNIKYLYDNIVNINNIQEYDTNESNILQYIIPTIVSYIITKIILNNKIIYTTSQNTIELFDIIKYLIRSYNIVILIDSLSILLLYTISPNIVSIDTTSVSTKFLFTCDIDTTVYIQLYNNNELFNIWRHTMLQLFIDIISTPSFTLMIKEYDITKEKDLINNQSVLSLNILQLYIIVPSDITEINIKKTLINKLNTIIQLVSKILPLVDFIKMYKEIYTMIINHDKSILLYKDNNNDNNIIKYISLIDTSILTNKLVLFLTKRILFEKEQIHAESLIYLVEEDEVNEMKELNDDISDNDIQNDISYTFDKDMNITKNDKNIWLNTLKQKQDYQIDILQNVIINIFTDFTIIYKKDDEDTINDNVKEITVDVQCIQTLMICVDDILDMICLLNSPLSSISSSEIYFSNIKSNKTIKLPTTLINILLQIYIKIYSIANIAMNKSFISISNKEIIIDEGWPSVLSSSQICISTISLHLRLECLQYLKNMISFINTLIYRIFIQLEYSNNKKDNKSKNIYVILPIKSINMLQISLLYTLKTILRIYPKFLSPYIQDILSILLSPVLIDSTDMILDTENDKELLNYNNKQNDSTVSSCLLILAKYAPPHILIKNIFIFWKTAKENGIIPSSRLLKLVSNVCDELLPLDENTDTTDNIIDIDEIEKNYISDYYELLTKFFIMALDTRNEYIKNISQYDTNDTKITIVFSKKITMDEIIVKKMEEMIISSIMHMIMKLNENQLGYILKKIYEWIDIDINTINDEKKPIDIISTLPRIIPLFKLYNVMICKLKILFIPYILNILDIINQFINIPSTILKKECEEINKIYNQVNKKKRRTMIVKYTINNIMEEEKEGSIEEYSIPIDVRFMYRTLASSYAIEIVQNSLKYDLEFNGVSNDTTLIFTKEYISKILQNIIQNIEISYILRLEGSKIFIYNDNDIFSYTKYVDTLQIPCLGKISIHLGKINPMMWDLLVHHTLLKTHSKYSKVRHTALSAIHQYFLLNREDFLLFLPRIVPRVAELLQDTNPSIEALTKEVIALIEKQSGESISQYLN